ncbi:MAG: precorrin-2 C(20)-methyltransferase [Hormoscilla sp.]
MNNGILYGIGVGPGDPELITLKGLRLLQRVPVIAYPAGVSSKPGMAEQIISQWLDSEKIKLPLKFPYVQDLAVLSQAWQRAVAQIWPYLQQGQDVAFVCEGDVSFYSTFNNLANCMQQQHGAANIQLIPGISSPMAAAAAMGIPLTMGAQRLAVLPALYAVEELENVLNWADVVVLMKVSSVYPQVWQLLHKRQLLEKAYVVERVTWPDQRLYNDIGSRPDLKLSYFSVLIVNRN